MKLIKPQQWSAFNILVLAGLLILLFTMPALSQSRTHSLGDFKYQVDDNDAISTSGDNAGNAWPQDHYRYWQIHFYNTLFLVGSWVDEQGGVHSKDVIMDPISYNNEPPYGIFEYRKHEPAEVWVYVEGNLQRSSRPFNGEVVPDLPSDQMIELHYKAYPGFDVVKKTYSYTNENHNDYIIFYNRFLCTFDWDEDPEPDTDDTQTITDMYITFGYTFQNAEGTWITFNRWYEEAVDDWATYETFTPTHSTGGRDLHITYGWDGDHVEVTEFEVGGQEFDDTGDPRFAIGESASSFLPSAEFISSEYAGFAALHVDSSPSDRSDDVSQPTSVYTNLNIYNLWDSDYPGYATAWDWAAASHKETVENQSGWPDDPSSVEAEMPLQAFGPYDFSLGDSVVIVYAVAVNGIDRTLAIEKGLEWREWYRGVPGAEFDDDAKNALIATSKDSLFESLDRALWAWNEGLTIPSPLPAPDLTVTSGPNEIYLEWEDMSEVGDPNTGVPDLAHYNIYRKEGKFLVDTYDELNSEGTHLLYEKIEEIPSNQTSWTDQNVIRGQSYHYAVTAVDDGTQNADGIFPGQQLESSVYANRSEIAAIPFLPGATTSDQVRIVPNPYIIGAEDFNFSGNDNQILFANLPPYCTLRIYTATGDLIKTIEHTSGSADEIWDQVTESTQYVASGVYILQISNARDLENKELPDSNEKFVIIR
jgi:hypothetical protein